MSKLDPPSNLGWYYQKWKALPYEKVSAAFEDLGPVAEGPGGAQYMPESTGAVEPPKAGSPLSTGILVGVVGVMLLINFAGKKKKRR